MYPATNQRVDLVLTCLTLRGIFAVWETGRPNQPGAGRGRKNFPYLRFSDILLIYAEALSEASGNPCPRLNIYLDWVQTRAGLEPLSGLSKAQFKDAVLQERRLEFTLEGQRWFDLTRTGRLLDAVKAETSFWACSDHSAVPCVI